MYACDTLQAYILQQQIPYHFHSSFPLVMRGKIVDLPQLDERALMTYEFVQCYILDETLKQRSSSSTRSSVDLESCEGLESIKRG